MSAPRIGRVLLPLGLLLTASCAQSTRVPPPFVFDTPGEVELVCYDTTAPREGRTADSDARVLLPFACCTPEVQRQSDPALRPAACVGATPVAHALITQSSDGEVAAVDLSNNKVLDSELRIPGYTFVDVGGLPTAIVVPRNLPSEPDAEATPSGPVWTYVAGREHNSVRAIPTCRFLLGRPCGPELGGRGQVEVFLPDAPQDMVLDPAGAALWVTLPKLGVIARVDLGTEADAAELAEGAPVPPFALEPTDDGSMGLREPVYFALPAGLNVRPADPTLLPALKVEPSYEAVCGLDFSYDPAEAAAAGALELPSSQAALSTGTPEPTRLHLLTTEPAAGEAPENLLLVADYGQAVVHALAIVGDQLENRGAQDVRARLRDFAVTRKVPVSAPSARELKDDAEVYRRDPEGPYEANAKQYLYGIDEIGGVMAFELSFAGRSPVLELLRAPMPRRDSVKMSGNFADRLFVNLAESPARALDVIDTRSRDVGNESAAYCEDSARSLSSRLNAARAAVSSATLAYQGASAADLPARAEQLALRRAELTAVEELVAQHDQLGPNSLRGVYLTVSASDGRVSVLDIHDLDLKCRAQKSCGPIDTNDASGVGRLLDTTNSAAVVLRRHTPRVLAYTPATVTINGSDEVRTTEQNSSRDCPPGFYTPSDGAGVCVPRDPWTTRNGVWVAAYEGQVVNLNSGVLELSAEGVLTARAPEGFSLCERGVLAEQFQLAVASSPTDASRELECPIPTEDTAQRLLITAAYDDRLELALPTNPDPARINLTSEQLLRCYPRFVNLRVLLYQAFLVSNGAYLHRTKADEEGRCVVDESIDPRFTSRALPGEQFQDPSIAFTLEAPTSTSLRDVNPTITLSAQTSLLSRNNIDGNSGRNDAGPRRVRYFPETGDLFVVDQASQGLKRFSMTPFEADSASIR